MRPSRVTLLVCAALALAVPAAGTVIDVPGEQPTIAAGLAAASPGDTVRVACDTYNEHDLDMPSGVTLVSASADPSCVTIDGESADVILHCAQTTGAVVSGITFTHGGGSVGGAVLCEDATVTFDNCVFIDTDAQGGAAIYWFGGTPEITGCDFSTNTATAGGAIFLKETDGSVTDCTFTGNEALFGGGVYLYGGSTITAFTGCDFVGNTATMNGWSGGAVCCLEAACPSFESCYFEGNSGCRGGALASKGDTAPTFTECEFRANTSTERGGAAFCDSDAAAFEDCEFIDNAAGDGWGGALCFMYSSTATADGCTFYGNEAELGGGILATDHSSISISGCTFARNEVPGRGAGAGIYILYDADIAVHASIIAFSVTGEAVACSGAGNVTLTCSDVFGNDGGDWVDCIAGQEGSGGNLNVDPLFCNLPACDLTLCADSECLPAHNDCGELVGAWPEGCPPCGTAVEAASWGIVKGMYR
jgi:predicted outer membrane repeat protein